MFTSLSKFFSIEQFQPSVAFHIETSHLSKTNDWFLYETQHWVEMGYASARLGVELRLEWELWVTQIKSLSKHMGQSIQEWIKENLWKTAF